MQQPRVTIGVPFTAWNEYIRQTVDACLALDYQNLTLVLVTNFRPEIPRNYLDHPKIVFVFCDSPKIGEKRDLALRALPSDFHGCLDSDSFPNPDWLNSALPCFQKEGVWAVGGPNISPSYTSLKKIAVANAQKSLLVSGPKCFQKRVSASRFVSDLPTCNLILRTEKIVSIGGFGKNFHVGEDTELCDRVVRAGGKIYFSSDTIVTHHNRALFSAYVKQRIVYGYSYVPILKQNISLKRIVYLCPLILVATLLTAAFLLLFTGSIGYLGIALFAYLALIALEAVHLSKHVKTVGPTALAILVGNLSPGIGTFLYLTKMRINLERFYKNF